MRPSMLVPWSGMSDGDMEKPDPVAHPVGWSPGDQKVITSGEVRTHALKRGPELESGALTTRPQMLARALGWFDKRLKQTVLGWLSW
jgi:hypothetical protein